ncbi:contact-dependent growth inhibition system immunity protein [Psychrobacter immobilis]|uniref:contact-dependent growth inhibition system immunity protein n=1 Tax=Psychrobacter immobilis TaxID=498 RepID=UPI00191980D0
MINTFTYLMNAYFYQEWWTEYSDPRVSDKEVLVRFASNENIKILNSLVQDLEYILANDLATTVFENNSLDFDPLLHGYSSEQAWVESAYRIISLRIN